ncbi:class I SAM-dependent methyltransferase [Pseudonocardia sp.]|uniref:class I SAM-dependent methyltransferase n=1 Tax=Pseudonocardia sp. TaxID=60912 RepID=UPI0031FCA857
MDGTVRRLRATFDNIAARYHAVRPSYPLETVDDLRRLAELRTGSRALEIGCGTGQLTVPLAQLGVAVAAVELGAALADVARRNLAAYPSSEVIVGAFEDAALADEAFDLVVAATSFHWVDPAIRVTKSARVLRPGGYLAVIDTHHVAGGTEQFFRDAQDCYEMWDPATPPGLRLPTAGSIPVSKPDIDDSPLFEQAVLRRYVWEAEYSTSDYLTLMLTYSGHLALPSAQQNGLLDCIGSLMDSRFGGTVTKRYLTELRVARRRDRAVSRDPGATAQS